MTENTSIEWADHTFNPWIGCTKVSAACDHCYAEAWDHRFGGVRWGPHAPRTRTSAANWRKVLRWNELARAAGVRHRVFCASLADVFDNHRSITSGWRGDLWHLIHRTPHLDWLLLTKRPQNIVKMLPESYGEPRWGAGWPNVWLGTTVENQDEADRRIPALLSVSAKVHFISCEPLLGPLNIEPYFHDSDCDAVMFTDAHCSCDAGGGPFENTVRWVIAGGESGPHARPSNPQWFRNLQGQCQHAGVPFLFKQWGEWVSVSEVEGPGRIHEFDDHRCVRRVGKKRAGRTLDGVTYDEFPRGEV